MTEKSLKRGREDVEEDYFAPYQPGKKVLALSDDLLPLSEDFAPILEVEDIMVRDNG